MDLDDMMPRKTNDPLTALAREDLDPLSVAELDARIAALEMEIVRVKAKREGASAFRSAADQLFRKG